MPIFNERLNRQKSLSSANLFRKRDSSENCVIRLNKSKYPKELLRKYRLCLKYVPKDVTAEKIELLCSKYGKVLDVTYSPKTPYKFVSFSSLSEMEKALEGLKDNQYGFIADIAKDKHQDDDTISVSETLLGRINDDELFANMINDFKYTRRNSDVNSKNRNTNEEKHQKETPPRKMELREKSSNRKDDTSSNSKNKIEEENFKTKQNEGKNLNDINKKNIDDNIMGGLNTINNDKSITGYCTLCSRIGDKACGRCGDCYCSLQCQKIDWKRHRYFCLPMPHLVPLAYVADYHASMNVQNHKILNNDSSILQISSSNQQIQQQQMQQQIQQQQIQQQISMKTGMCDNLQGLPLFFSHQNSNNNNAMNMLNMRPHPLPHPPSSQSSITPYYNYNYNNAPPPLPPPSVGPPPPQQQQKAYGNTMQQRGPYSSMPHNYNNSANDPRIANTNNNKQQQQQKSLTNNVLINDKDPKKDKPQNQIASTSNCQDKKNTQKATENESKPKEIEQKSFNKESDQEPVAEKKELVVKEATKPPSTQNENESEKAAKNEVNLLQDAAITAAQFPSTGSHVQITAVIKPDLVYIRSLDTESNVQYVKAINIVNNESRKSKLLDKIPNKGDLVSAIFEDIGYYRALVLNPINENRIIVAFIDNGEITEKRLSEMKELSNEAKLFKRYVFPIKLKDIPSNISNKLRLDEIMDYLNSYVDCCEKELKIIYEKKDTKQQEPSDIDAELIEITSNENLNNHILKILNK